MAVLMAALVTALSTMLFAAGAARAADAPTDLALVAAAGERAPQPAFTLGIGSARRWGASGIPFAKALGVASVRTDAPWREIETERGRLAVPAWMDEFVDSARAAGMAPVLILDYGNPLHSADKPKSADEVEAFKRYAVFMVQHFKGRVRTYEVWNEWNNGVGGTTPGTPETYIAFARQIVPALRAADPAATLLSAGVSPGGLRGGWLHRFLEQGGHRLFDGVSIHPYSWPWKTDRSPEAAIRLVDGYQDAARRANDGKPVDFYINEMGWPTVEGQFGESRDAVAAFLSRFVLLASCRPYVRGVWWFTLFDDSNTPGDSEHNNYGVYDFDKRMKPAALALKSTAGLLGQSAGRCSVTSAGDEVALTLPLASGVAPARLAWQGGVVAPGGAAFQDRGAVRAGAAAASAAGARVLFPTSNGATEGVPFRLDAGAP